MASKRRAAESLLCPRYTLLARPLTGHSRTDATRVCDRMCDERGLQVTHGVPVERGPDGHGGRRRGHGHLGRLVHGHRRGRNLTGRKLGHGHGHSLGHSLGISVGRVGRVGHGVRREGGGVHFLASSLHTFPRDGRNYTGMLKMCFVTVKFQIMKLYCRNSF